jgi:hypothetical protein
MFGPNSFFDSPPSNLSGDSSEDETKNKNTVVWTKNILPNVSNKTGLLRIQHLQESVGSEWRHPEPGYDLGR